MRLNYPIPIKLNCRNQLKDTKVVSAYLCEKSLKNFCFISHLLIFQASILSFHMYFLFLMRFQGSEIANQPVMISSCGTYNIDPSPYLVEFEEAEVQSNSVVCIIYPCIIPVLV